MRLDGPATPDSDRGPDDFLVGAAIGTGMAALSAIRGGADFLLALSAGRIRTMGEPSIATMLPLQENNAYVFSFAEREILPRASIPVFFGASTFDPRQDLEALVERIAAAGFAGIANFPTACLIDGQLRQIMEAAKVGFGRELDLLALARRAGLRTLAYTHTINEARQAAARGVDIVNINFGWNMGGAMGVDSGQRIDEVALLAQSSARVVRALAPATRCVVEGGPIVSPRQLEQVCRIARIDGYIGGSTIDRVPSESAMEVVTSAFKAIGALRNRIDGLERQLEGRSYPLALRGRSAGIQAARALYARLVQTHHPFIIAGEPGTGRREVARTLHGAGPRKLREPVTVACTGTGREEAEALRLSLFGAVARPDQGIFRRQLGWIELSHGSSLILDGLDRLDRQTQSLLLAAIETRRYCAIGGTEPVDFGSRLIGLVSPAGAEPWCDGHFLAAIGSFQIELPPLRERLEDLPLLVEAMLSRLSIRDGRPRQEIDPAAYRILEAHHWPGNLLELRSVLENAALAAQDTLIGPDQLQPLGAPADVSDDRHRFTSESEWIMDALKRNRFRRTQTARFLGISRKTLYNKMRRQGLLHQVEKKPER